jgi:hypothetical protein
MRVSSPPTQTSLDAVPQMASSVFPWGSGFCQHHPSAVHAAHGGIAASAPASLADDVPEVVLPDAPPDPDALPDSDAEPEPVGEPEAVPVADVVACEEPLPLSVADPIESDASAISPSTKSPLRAPQPARSATRTIARLTRSGA